MKTIQFWLSATRPATLLLAISATGLGIFLAAADGTIDILAALLCTLTAVMLQILANLANDYGDEINGAQTLIRVNPLKSGAIDIQALELALKVTLSITSFFGLMLILRSPATNQPVFVMLFTVLGIFCILASVGYTMGSRPYGYRALGDLSVFIFFGLVAVVGSYFLLSADLKLSVLLPAASVGMFSTAVLNINNIRDIEIDTEAGKLTIAALLGHKKAGKYHWILLIAGIGFAVIYAMLDFQGIWQGLFLLTIPVLLYNGYSVNRIQAENLDPMIRHMVFCQVLFVITFGLGQLFII